VLARTRSASLRSLPHDGGSDDADLAAGSSTGQPAHGLTPGLDYLLRHEVSVASESMHGIQNPSEVRVDTQPRREREQLCLREALLIHGKPSDSGRKPWMAEGPDGTLLLAWAKVLVVNIPRVVVSTSRGPEAAALPC
jgi:hypothetical protein